MKNNRKRRRLKFRDDDGQLVGSLNYISIVTEPAIGVEFEQFSAEQLEVVEKMKFSVLDEDQMIFAGPAMIPNIGMMRKDRMTGEMYDGYFTEEDIDDAVFLYHRYGKMNESKFEHKSFSTTDEIFLLHDWRILDPNNDTANAMGYDTSKLPVKTWFVMFKCTNPEMWKQLKESNFKGFSVESEILIEDFSTLAEEIKISKQEQVDVVSEGEISELEQIIETGVPVKGKYSMVYNLIKDILFAEGLNDEAKYRLMRKILKKV